MIEFELGYFATYKKEDVANTLREIANRINEGYTSGLTDAEGVCWSIDGEEENEED